MSSTTRVPDLAARAPQTAGVMPQGEGCEASCQASATSAPAKDFYIPAPPPSCIDPCILEANRRVEDVDYLFSVVSKTFPFFGVHSRLGYEPWTSKHEQWLKQARRAEEPRAFAAVIDGMMKALHTGHAAVLSEIVVRFYAEKDNPSMRPYQEVLSQALSSAVYWDSVLKEERRPPLKFDAYYLDGRYLLRDDLELVDGSRLPAGTQIVGIDGLSVDEYISRNQESLILREDAITGGIFAKNLLSELSEDSGVEFEVDDLGTRATVRSIDVQERSRCMTHRPSPGRYFYLDLIPGEVAYVKLDSFKSMRKEPGRAAAFERFIDEHADARAVILDLRGNTGGSSVLWSDEILGAMLSSGISTEVYYGLNANETTRDFIDAKIEPISTIFPGERAPANVFDELRRGEINALYRREEFIDGKRKRPLTAKIYMLVDRDVYSSSEMFAAWAKASGWAVIVGEQTGGDGIGVDPFPAVLPNSLMAVRFPWILGASSDGAINEQEGTIPDVVTTWQVEDWRGRCDAVQRMKKLEPEQGIWNETNARELFLKHDPDVAAALRDLRRRD